MPREDEGRCERPGNVTVLDSNCSHMHAGWVESDSDTLYISIEPKRESFLYLVFNAGNLVGTQEYLKRCLGRG